jgi:hypothetical protein
LTAFKAWHAKKDIGPFWLSDEERANNKHNNFVGTFKLGDKTKTELLVNLRNSGFDATSQRFLKNDLVEICTSWNIPTCIREEDSIPGWLHALKGRFQMLHERE